MFSSDCVSSQDMDSVSVPVSEAGVDTVGVVASRACEALGVSRIDIDVVWVSIDIGEETFFANFLMGDGDDNGTKRERSVMGSGGDTLFGSKLEDDAVDTMDIAGTSIELVMSDNLQEKYNKLNVEAELQVSLMAGLIRLSGSGSYLGEERKSARAQSMSLIYKLRTVNEEIMLRQNKNKIDLEILSPSTRQTVNATHVVVAIDWGAVCTVTCEYETKEDENVTEVKGALSAELKKIKGVVDAKGSTKASYDDKNKENHKTFTFKCKADVLARGKDLPVTFEGAVELARNLPSLVKGTNKGKGVQLLYMLMPLNDVVNICRLQIQLQIEYTSINDDIIKKCAQVVEGITNKRQSLYDIQNDLHASAEYVAEGSLGRIDEILNKFIVQESGFKSELQDLVKKVRSGILDVSKIEAFLDKELSGAFSISRYNDHIRGFQKELNKLKSIKSWKKRGIIYIGKKDEVTVDDKRMVYTLYKAGEENVNYEKNQEFFLRLQKTHAHEEDYKFMVVDQDLREDIWPSRIKKTTIRSFVDGRRTSKDLFAKEGQDSEMCLIKVTRPVYQQTHPNNRAYVQLRCPNALAGNGQCSGEPVTWKCSRCKELVEYGIETKRFYCKCGKSDPKESRWRCNEADHGMIYVKYQHDILSAELSYLRAIKERNILILGETGVGKSTWINGFINYLYYANLEEAMNAKEFHVSIPSSFTFTQQGKAKKVMVGESDTNEKVKAGESATKETRSYVFQIGGDIIRLIDTPGIGDTAGIQQDRKNFENILSYLTYYTEIHAVCILLKPNQSRLTTVFRFCIQELLAHLHSSAKNNIVFCFTNARATFYKPGDTLPILNKELWDKQVGIEATPSNYFCFDNEPFRFLACVKNGVEFSKLEIKTYAESWNASVEETKKLFKHIDSLTPHNIRNTLNMNEARRIIVAMSKPLAEVAKTIQQNVQEGNEAKTQIDLVDRHMDSLKADLKFSGFDLQRVELDHPRTVCTDSKCIRYVPIGASSRQNILYEQQCHPECSLSGIPTETTNDARLQGCWCIDGTNCSQCGHHFTTHMHMTYDLRVFPMEFLSEEVQAQINQKKSIREAKKAFKEAIDTKIAELEKEETTIVKTSAKYGSFLKANAIIPYNDAVGDYLDMIIDQERKKAKAIQNPTFLTTMEDMKRQYEHERQILDEAIDEDGGENIHTPEEVMKLQKELFGLKHMGQTLKDLFDGISISHSARNMAFKEKIVPIPQSYKKKGAKSTRTSDHVVTNIKVVHGLPSDHHAVKCHLDIARPRSVKKLVKFRELKKVDVAKLKSDIDGSTLTTDRSSGDL
ncbi:uncharacterized protein LOC119730696 [Patiria miniata]|uniref:G domain-containing protein n=1 Tax=Patiria miniata TaxID=46514 RepID=A0A914A6Y6_PATMI|nr:uncharacterized protein LOC119730696 [Patiria miniata]